MKTLSLRSRSSLDGLAPGKSWGGTAGVTRLVVDDVVVFEADEAVKDVVIDCRCPVLEKEV